MFVLSARWLFILILAGHSVLVSAETLRVVAHQWPPYVDGALPQKGLAIDLIQTAFNRAGYDVSLDIKPWSEALEGTKLGVFDVVANIWYTDARAAKLDYSDPYLVNDIRFVKLKSNPAKFHRFEDLKGLKIGVVKDYAYPKEFADANGLIRVEHTALLPALGELVSGHVDLVIGDHNSIKALLIKHLPNQAKNLEVMKRPVGLKKLYVAASRANPKHGKIIKDFNAALKSMQQDGLYQSLIADYQKVP